MSRSDGTLAHCIRLCLQGSLCLSFHSTPYGFRNIPKDTILTYPHPLRIWASHHGDRLITPLQGDDTTASERTRIAGRGDTPRSAPPPFGQGAGASPRVATLSLLSRQRTAGQSRARVSLLTCLSVRPSRPVPSTTASRIGASITSDECHIRPGCTAQTAGPTEARSQDGRSKQSNACWRGVSCPSTASSANSGQMTSKGWGAAGHGAAVSDTTFSLDDNVGNVGFCLIFLLIYSFTPRCIDCLYQFQRFVTVTIWRMCHALTPSHLLIYYDSLVICNAHSHSHPYKWDSSTTALSQRGNRISCPLSRALFLNNTIPTTVTHNYQVNE